MKPLLGGIQKYNIGATNVQRTVGMQLAFSGLRPEQKSSDTKLWMDTDPGGDGADQ